MVIKKSLFLQKCQCIELLTVFIRLHIYSILYSTYSIFSSKLTFKSGIFTSEKKDQVPELGSGGGVFGDSGNARKKRFFSIEAIPNDDCQNC